jgi:hypothetical protein
MGSAALDHAQNGREYSADGGDLATILISRRRQREEVPEQLVGAVDQIDVQGMPPRTTL